MHVRLIGSIWAAVLVLAFPVPGRAAVTHDLSQATLAQVRVAFTHANNIYLTNALGGDRVTVTTRGTDLSARHSVRYLSYSWSPDGRYLLLVRQEYSKTFRESLLLLDQHGSVLRTLVSNVLSYHFFPSWALDSDQIVYEAWAKPLKNAPNGTAYHAVNRVDLFGRKTFLWGFAADDACESFGGPPADELYQEEMGQLLTRPSMQWSISRHLAVYSTTCNAGLLVTDMRTGRTRPLGAGNAPWYDAAISPSGTLAASSGHLISGPAGPVVLANARTGAVVKTLGPGEFPSWSPDGRFLYFVRRTTGSALKLLPTIPTEWSGELMQTYTTSIWRANADGSHLLLLTSQDAFGFGHLQVTPDGRSLIYSRVDNPWNLWRHRLPGNRYTAALLQRYGPRVSIQRLGIGGQPVTIAEDAGRPEIMPNAPGQPLPSGEQSAAPRTVTVQLHPARGGSVRGRATLTAVDGATRAYLDVRGLPPGSRAAALIHYGVCSDFAHLSASAAALPNLRADATGRARATGRVLTALQKQNVRLSVLADGHHALVIALPRRGPVACGTVP